MSIKSLTRLAFLLSCIFGFLLLNIGQGFADSFHPNERETPQITQNKTLYTTNAPTASPISNKPFFDKCNIGTTSQMQTWWTYSPYWEVNLYIGGSNRGCANSGLTASWVSTVSAQGWNFVPTWVGPQAPCSGFGSRISYDITTAYNQGRNEAGYAVSAANNLGLSNSIVYYDMEAYSNTTSCRNAVKSFMSGWVKRLHELGFRAGGYGSACASYLSDWSTIANVPDDIWPAHWIYSAYNSNANVWNVACISNNLWTTHQRLRQYAGGHNETWGSLTFNIDSDIADGHVAGTHPRALLMPESDWQESIKQEIQDIHFLTATVGWIQTNQQLMWTENGGQSWSNITPNLNDLNLLHSAFFLNDGSGWAIVSSAKDAGPSHSFAILYTSDHGQTWQILTDSAFKLDSSQFAQSLSIDFINTQTGWVTIKLGSSSNFSLGLLFKTEDGGHTWSQLNMPLGDPTYFINSTTGWVAGGQAGDKLYITQDGGNTWTEQKVAQGETGSLFYDLPTFTNEQDGVLPVTVTGPTGSQLLIYTTSNAGQSWNLSSSFPLNITMELGAKVVVQVIDKTHWVFIEPMTNQLQLVDAGKIVNTVPFVSQGLSNIIKVDFSTLQTGGVLVTTNSCGGVKASGEYDKSLCTTTNNAWKTTNGGATWQEILP